MTLFVWTCIWSVDVLDRCNASLTGSAGKYSQPYICNGSNKCWAIYFNHGNIDQAVIQIGVIYLLQILTSYWLNTEIYRPKALILPEDYSPQAMPRPWADIFPYEVNNWCINCHKICWGKHLNFPQNWLNLRGWGVKFTRKKNWKLNSGHFKTGSMGYTKACSFRADTVIYPGTV